MTPPLFLVAELGTDPQLVLTGPEAHHAATVKRLRVGESALLSDGLGGLARAVVASVAADRVVFEVLSRSRLEPAVPLFVVVQALPKGERAELAVEALTELGVDEIVPWSAARSVTVWKGERVARGLARWRRTAAEASKQSRRPRAPVVAELADTAEVLRRVAAARVAILLESEATEPVAGLLDGVAPREFRAGDEVVLVVGPEGGLAPVELAALQQAGALPGRLGPEVLRTATAGAAALAVLSVAVGRWR